MICGLANEMAKTENVTVCSMFEPQDDDIFWNKLSSNVHRITLGKSKEGFSPKTIIKIWSLINRGGYDIINMHGFFYYYVLSVYTQRNKAHFFYTIHSDASKENGSWGRYVFGLKKYSFIKGYVNPITISKASNESFRSVYGIDGRVIVNGIPKPVVSNQVNLVDEMRSTSCTKVFVHPGRITEAKNQVVLCRVFDLLIKEGFDVALIIAGSKQEESIFEEMSPYFSERIKYVGERNDITELLARSDGMCLPSIWEGLPVTLLEALSVGCVPICAPVGGIVNVIHDRVNGILSRSSNLEDYLSTMKYYLSLSQSEINSLKVKAAKSFEPYDIVKTSQEYLEYYRESL